MISKIPRQATTRRLHSLPNSLALALSLAFAGESQAAQTFAQVRIVESLAPATAASALAATAVFNCTDSGPGSLRQAVSAAADGATIDMTQLTCSLITLTSGAIAVGVNNLTIDGPGPNKLKIAGSLTPQFIHTGAGTLTLRGLTLASGYHKDNPGGCVSSQGSLVLDHVAAYACETAMPDFPVPNGGGAVYAFGDVTIADSDIALNRAYGPDKVAGGGVFAGGNLTVRNSTVAYNTAISLSFYSYGGAMAAGRNVDVTGVLISANRSGQIFDNGPGAGLENGFGGGIAILNIFGTASATITNSTIYGNTATAAVGGVLSGAQLQLRNSTIAFNKATVGTARGIDAGAGLFQDTRTVDLQSSIIAHNQFGANLFDFSVYKATVSGANNLIMGSSDSPVGTLTTEAQLDSLHVNGGPTQTLALVPGSPAIGHGNNIAGLVNDQRGPGFARSFAGKTDIGAFQTGDSPFNNGFDTPN